MPAPVPVPGQVEQLGVHSDDDVAAGPAVAAIRAGSGLERLARQVGAPGAARPRSNLQSRSVHEHGSIIAVPKTSRRRYPQRVDEPEPEPDDAQYAPAPDEDADAEDLEPSEVWMVSRETGQEGWAGIIKLDGDAFMFLPLDGGAPRSFPLDEIRKIHRVVGSPVLEIKMAPTAQHRLVGFYFIRPPTLSTEPGARMKKRSARRHAILTLRVANEAKRNEIRDWVAAIRRAKAKLA
jgi:hypothetical protein